MVYSFYILIFVLHIRSSLHLSIVCKKWTSFPEERERERERKKERERERERIHESSTFGVFEFMILAGLSKHLCHIGDILSIFYLFFICREIVYACRSTTAQETP